MPHTGIALVGFFIGGVLGVYAFRVRLYVCGYICICGWIHTYVDGCTCAYTPPPPPTTNISPIPPSKKQQHYEHGALLFNVGLTAALALAHTCYVSYHERMSVLAVLESKSEYVKLPNWACMCLVCFSIDQHPSIVG